MAETTVLLNAYYELLHERLEAGKDLVTASVKALLAEEMPKLAGCNFDDEKYAAYLEACLAFVDERLETYNPLGIQYTFDRLRAEEAVELELQLNWYDSRPEFEALAEKVKQYAEPHMTSRRIRELADRLITEAGAFADKTIISAYQADPKLQKLPDYIVARAIEQIIRQLNPRTTHLLIQNRSMATSFAPFSLLAQNIVETTYIKIQWPVPTIVGF